MKIIKEELTWIFKFCICSSAICGIITIYIILAAIFKENNVNKLHNNVVYITNTVIKPIDLQSQFQFKRNETNGIFILHTDKAFALICDINAYIGDVKDIVNVPESYSTTRVIDEVIISYRILTNK